MGERGVGKICILTYLCGEIKEFGFFQMSGLRHFRSRAYPSIFTVFIITVFVGRGVLYIPGELAAPEGGAYPTHRGLSKDKTL